MNNMAIDTERISFIQKHLYIGTWKAAVYATAPEKLGLHETQKMDVVISALSEEEYEDYDLLDEDFEDVSWYRLVIDDYILENIYEHFNRVYLIIETAIKSGKNVLVHCAAGISRSPTLVAAYLLLSQQYQSAEEAIEYLKKMRPIVNPNMGFERQLEELEDNIKKGLH